MQFSAASFYLFPVGPNIVLITTLSNILSLLIVIFWIYDYTVYFISSRSWSGVVIIVTWLWSW
jgi:hypothetical protein